MKVKKRAAPSPRPPAASISPISQRGISVGKPGAVSSLIRRWLCTARYGMRRGADVIIRSGKPNMAII